MARTIITLAALAALLLPAFSQTARKTQDPESILFQAFFRPVMLTEDAAAALRAKGKPDAEARDYLKRRAGLNTAEDSLVKEIARSCAAEYQAESQRGMAIVRELRVQYPVASAIPASVADQIDRLEDARAQVTARCVASLRRAMGSRFQQIDTFARQTIGPRIRHVDAETKQ
jgi:hypothetical protein